jgi:uncharacterized membrane protein YsdA (DUF1294 family)
MEVMVMEPNFVLIYLVVINLIGFFSMALDKWKAKNRKWRISEFTLMFIALIGGAIGSTISMYLFHHKTNHWKFKIGFPLLFMIQTGLITFYFMYLS